MFPHLKDVVANALVVDGVGAVLVVAIEQTLQLPLHRRDNEAESACRKHACLDDVAKPIGFSKALPLLFAVGYFLFRMALSTGSSRTTISVRKEACGKHGDAIKYHL